jgi:hypothetical protein
MVRRSTLGVFHPTHFGEAFKNKKDRTIDTEARLRRVLIVWLAIHSEYVSQLLLAAREIYVLAGAKLQVI